MSLTLASRRIANAVVIDIAGELTVYDEGLREYARQFLDSGERRLVLNLAAISYLDSAGLGKLVSLYITVKNAAGEIELLAPGPRVRELLKITKLDTVFTILENEAAVRASTSAALPGV
jgi:anti-sigma B factor antagonist